LTLGGKFIFEGGKRKILNSYKKGFRIVSNFE